MSIRVEHLTRRFGAQHAVKDLSFEVTRGQICGFLGPNGAGKTTTMKMICGVLTPTSGNVLVEGLDVEQQPQTVKRSIGYLPEHNPLYGHMYVREFLRFAGKLYAVPHLDQRVDDMIARTGLEREQHKRIHMLSKGYKQRVGLAQAMIHDPSVLILDEPISGLDPNQLVDIRHLIKSIAKDKTVLFSSHIMQEVEAICDRVIIINRGEMRSDMSIEDIRGAGAQAQVKIAFSERVDKGLIAALPAVHKVDDQGEHFVVTLTHPRDGRLQVSQLALDKGWLLMEMTTLERGVESVFHEMTT